MSRLRRMSMLSLAIVVSSGAWAPSASAATSRPTPRYHAAEAGAAFGLSLMRHLPSGNLVISPDSIEAALAMAGTGAAGQTAQQIAKVLALSSPAAFEEVGRLQKRIAAEQGKASGAPALNIAGGLFVQRGLELEAPFTTTLAQAFGTAPQTVDFEHDRAAALAAINEWASRQTHGLIPRVLNEVSPETVLALANAIYLKAKWSSPFKSSATREERFSDGTRSISTPFMNETEEIPYAAGRGYALVELPYASSSLSLAIVLPSSRDTSGLVSSLTAPALTRMLAGARRRNVQLSIPKFDLSAHLDLVAPLKALGMTDAFGLRANFERIATAPSLKIGSVVHAADIDVYEEGTEAAAVTVVEVEPTLARLYSNPVSFTADRPFLFFLRDRESGAILFEGRVEDPSSG